MTMKPPFSTHLLVVDGETDALLIKPVYVFLHIKHEEFIAYLCYMFFFEPFGQFIGRHIKQFKY